MTEVVIASVGACLLSFMGSEIIVTAAITNHMPPGLWVPVAMITMIGATGLAPREAPRAVA